MIPKAEITFGFSKIESKPQINEKIWLEMDAG